MATLSSQFVVTLWIILGLVLRSNARVLSKLCSEAEVVAVVNSSRLFGFPVECRDVCEVIAVFRDSVDACSDGIHERIGWTSCASSSPEVMVLQDDNKV